jgi:uncharacterized glyoxalase superfamily protein PhnB
LLADQNRDDHQFEVSCNQELLGKTKHLNGYYDQIKKRGVRIADPLTDQWWGDRTFTVMDPFGYQIWFFQTVGEVQPPPGAKIV